MSGQDTGVSDMEGAGHSVTMTVEQLQMMLDRAAEKAVERAMHHHITRDDAVDLMKEISTKSISDLMARMGIEADDLKNVRDDFSFNRALREMSLAVVRKGILTVVGLVIAGIVYAVWANIHPKL